MPTSHDGLLVETVSNGPFVENCFVVADEATKDAILIDPGDEEEEILAAVRALGVNVREIVNTHGHIDHVGAVATLKRVLGVPFAIHGHEQPLLAAVPASCRMFGLTLREVPIVDRDLAASPSFRVGDKSCSVLFTPGHTPGGCCLYFADQRVIFVGDTLFAGSVGRTDLPGGDTQQLLRSLREQLLTLPDDVVVYSGHGPETTIGVERRSNPFLRPDFDGF